MDASGTLRFQDVFRTETERPVSFVIDWTIPNFSFYGSFTRALWSNEHVTGRSSWYLALEPSDENVRGGNRRCLPPFDYITLVLLHHLPGESDYNIRTRVNISVLDANDNAVAAKTKEVHYTFTPADEEKGIGVTDHLHYNDLWIFENGSAELVADAMTFLLPA
ncbi:hypothetical protein RvY_10151 [Ramazzottius varieornatus]|uniref:Uncharacterized protein n=1 Tax=Ramazzottius varieornatus TaxID=947166 RepID=A0A1D1VH69_RAMVA|nr:hypothetical protein RvY_10151 [Ramazzottius varieornatus]